MADGTPRHPHPAATVMYGPDACVVDERHGGRTGRPVRVWAERPPVLYRLAGRDGGPQWLAWEYDLRPATLAEAAAYEAAAGALEQPRP